MPERVSAVVVSFADPAGAERAVDSLLEQSMPPIEVLLVDNHPEGIAAAAMAGWKSDPRVRLVHSGQNVGYTAGCNLAARQARGDWLVFINPDAHAATDCLSTLLAAAGARTGVLGAQVLLADGRTNAGDNPLHPTGIAWAGRFGEPREYGPPRRVACVSGAALLARAEAFHEVGGMCERFFLYEDDVDLCWRMRLAGWDVLFCPEAVVCHDYEFHKGTEKWFWLERNRIWTVLSNYSGLSLVLLAPLLLGTELMIGTLSVRGHWGRGYLRAWGSTFGALADLARWRRRVQAHRRVGDSEVLELMSGRFEPPQLHSGLALAMNPLIALYCRAVLAVVRLAGG